MVFTESSLSNIVRVPTDVRITRCAEGIGNPLELPEPHHGHKVDASTDLKKEGGNSGVLYN